MFNRNEAVLVVFTEFLGPIEQAICRSSEVDVRTIAGNFRLFGNEGSGPIAPMGHGNIEFPKNIPDESILVKQGAEKMFGFDLLLLGSFGDIRSTGDRLPGFFGELVRAVGLHDDDLPTSVSLDTIVENHGDLGRSDDRNVTILVAVIYWGMARMGDRNAGDRVRILLVCSIT